MFLEVLTLLCAFVLYFFAVLRPTGLMTANAVFVYLQLVMAVGTYPLLDPVIEADAVHGRIVLVTFLLYLLTSAAVLLHRPASIRVSGRWEPAPPSPRLYVPRVGVAVVVLFSIALTLLYFRSVGYSALLEGLQNSLTGGDADIAGLRLGSYAGDRYFAPGYVNQFKNALLPALVVVIITYWIRVGARHRLLTAGLVGFAVFALTGTGQRGAFVTFVLVAGLYLYFLNGRRFSPKFIKLGAGALAVFLVSTIALGREPATGGAGPLDQVVSALGGFVSRIFESQQISSVAGFRYIYAQPIQWGQEWWSSVAGMLPGQAGSDLANQIFATLYGSLRGTSPPSVWGSAYHNFGWLGVVVLPVLLGLLIGGVTRASAAPIERTTLELMGIAGVSVTLGMWMAGGPTAPINSGVVMFAALWWWGRNSRRLADRDATAVATRRAQRRPVGHTS